MEEMFIEKPVGKPVKNFRARVKMYGNDVVVVNPMEPRESNRRMIKQKGKSSFYKSEGEKESSYSIHINVDANDPDPVATMQEAFNDLTKGELKTEPKRAEDGTEASGKGQTALRLGVSSGVPEQDPEECGIQDHPAVQPHDRA